MQRPGDQICIDNRPTGSTQLFKIKARLNIQTVSKLKDLIITDEAYCDEPAPIPVKQVNRPDSLDRTVMFGELWCLF